MYSPNTLVYPLFDDVDVAVPNYYPAPTPAFPYTPHAVVDNSHSRGSLPSDKGFPATHSQQQLLHQDSTKHGGDREKSLMGSSSFFGPLFFCQVLTVGFGEGLHTRHYQKHEDRVPMNDYLGLIWDVLSFLCMPILQMAMYAVLLWNIAYLTTNYDSTFPTRDMFCLGGAHATDNAIFFLFEAVFFVMFFFDLRGSVEFYTMMKRPSYPLLAPLANKFKWAILIDQGTHILGSHILVGVTLFALYFQVGVGSMIIKAMGLVYLENFDDQLKGQLLARKGGEMATGWAVELAQRHEKQHNFEGEHQMERPSRIFVLLIAFHILCYLGFLGWLLFLAVQTGRGCKPGTSAASLFTIF